MQNPPVQMQPQPGITYVYTAAPTTSVRSNYAGTTSRALGITQVIMGVLLFVFQILSIVYSTALMFVGHGIWTGVIVVIAGAFGIAAASNKTTCLIVTFMVMSIISAVFIIIPLSLSATSLALDLDGGNYYHHQDNKDTTVALDALMLVVSTIEGLAAIWSSIICCKVVCCATQSNQNLAVQYAQAPPGAQPVNIIIAGPSGVVPQQGVQPAYIYPGAQGQPQYAVPQGQAQALPQFSVPPGVGQATGGEAHKGGDSPPPAYSNGNPMDQKSMPLPN